MSAREQTFVIVGASLAGAKAAETLREEGFDGRMVLIGDEPRAALRAPAAVQGLPARRGEREKAYVHADGFYAEHEHRAADRDRRSTRVDPARREVVLDDGETLGYDRLLLATGAEPRRLTVPGRRPGRRPLPARRRRLPTRCASASTPGGRVVGDRRRLDRRRGRRLGPPEGPRGDHHRPGGRAARARARPRGRRDLPRRPPRPRRRPAAGHRRRGVRGRRRGASGADRRRAHVECDFVVVGIGVVPRAELAEAPGSRSTTASWSTSASRPAPPASSPRATSANAWHPFYERRIRVEHWANALNQGPAAARAMLGAGRRLRPDPVLLLRPVRRRHGVLGLRDRVGRVVFRGDPAAREFIAFWLRDGASSPA